MPQEANFGNHHASKVNLSLLDLVLYTEHNGMVTVVISDIWMAKNDSSNNI